jgi:hypothetical protein
MGGQAIDLSGGMVPKQNIDLSGGLVPKAPAPDTRSLWQKAKDNFNSNTQGKQPGDNAVTGFIHDFSAGAGDIVRAAAHPVRTVESMASTPDPLFLEVAKAVTPKGTPAAGDIEQKLQDAGKNAPSFARTLGQVGTGAIVGEVAGPVVGTVAKNAAKVVPNLPEALSQAKQGFTRATYPKNVAIPAQEAAAQNLVKALVPDDAAIPNIKSAAAVVPDAIAAAEKNGTPINGKLDLAKTLRDRAAEVQGHYDDAILKPNAGDLNKVPDNYNGDTTTQGRASLKQINDRVDTINSELKSNFRKKLASQTTEANASDADLISEKQGLTSILHDRLAILTGLQPEDIANLRQNAGKLRSLAQEVGASANRDTKIAGVRQTSGGTMSMRNPVEGIADKLSGGQEVIGNRVIKQALEQFPAQETPLPQPQAPGPNIPTTPAAAQAEFLHQQQLEQAAQDASAGRSAIASEARQANVAADGGPRLWASQGYSKVLSHIADDPSSGLKAGDLATLRQTPAGAQLLMKASGLQPGSAMMKSVMTQIKNLLGAQK